MPAGLGWPILPGPQFSQLEQEVAHSWGGLSPAHRHVHTDLDHVAPVAPAAGLRVGKSLADSLCSAHPEPAGARSHFFHLEGTEGEGPPRGGWGLGEAIPQPCGCPGWCSWGPWGRQLRDI